MVPTKRYRDLIGSALAFFAILLGGCTSPAAPTSGSIATSTFDVSSVPVDAAGTDTSTATSMTSVFARRLDTSPTPAPPSAPTSVQGTDCGQIEMVGTGLVDDPRYTPALNCFWQAFQQCAVVGYAQLIVAQRMFETSTNRVFRLDGTTGSCVITEEVQSYRLMANTPQISMFTCTGLTRDSGGLHVLGCGSDGDFTFPALPFASVAVTPSPVSVPTIRTVTLAEDGQTIVLPVGTSFLLALDTSFDWQMRIADQTVIRPYPNAVMPPGSQGVFTASRQGQTTLDATGTPVCASATPPCAAPARQFTVQIVAN
jgi:hypothetical protein